VSFVEPLFLAGLLAAAIPIIIHLINRRNAVRQPFPALTLLQESDKKEARSIKVRRWLLMALRVLAIALLALALAKPYFMTDVQGAETSRYPTAVVFVLDDTMSMQHEPSSQSWFDTAKSRIRQRLDALKPWDKVSLITASATDEPVSRLVDSRSRIRSELEELTASHRTADLPNALRAAGDIASTSELPNRRIVLVSDFTRGGFPEPPTTSTSTETESTDSAGGGSNDENTKSAAEDADDKETSETPGVRYPVERVDVRSDSETTPTNLAVGEVDYRQVGPRKKGEWEISTSIHNYGDSAVDQVQVDLVIEDETVATRTVGLEAGESSSITMRHRVSGSGMKRARVELPDADNLAADNRRHFTLQLQRNVDVLLVNGAPSSVPYRDELYFAVRALKPNDDSESNIVPTTVSSDGLAGRDLSKFDVVLLANVSRINSETADSLQSFVQDGGGLFFAMGGNVEVDPYNSRLGNLLPKPLRRTKLLARRNDPDAPVKVTHIGSSKQDHPVFNIFDLPGGASLRKASIYSYMLLDPAPGDPKTSVLLSYKDGGPALLERRVGRGRVFLLTTTIDRGWTDLPLRTSFLPLMRRSMLYLARRTTSEDRRRYIVGDKISLDIAGLVDEQAVVRGPVGSIKGAGRETNDASRWVLSTEEESPSLTPNRPGVYEVWADEVSGSAGDQRSDETSESSDSDAGRLLDGLSFAVNVDHAESDLAPLPDDAYEPWLTPAGEGDGAADARAAPKRQVNLWPTILFCVTLALLFETLIGTRRSVLKRVWRRLTLRNDPDVEV